MPVLLKNYRVNDFSKRCTVYSKLKRITTSGFETSNDYYAGGNFGILQGLNDNSKDYFSLACNDIIEFNNLYVACGENSSTDNRTRLSTFLYSEYGGVSWTFGSGTFESGDGYGQVLIVSDGTLFCGGTGTDSSGKYGLMSSADGKTWAKVNSPFGEIDSMATNRSGEIVAVGFDTTNNKIVRYSKDNGSTWNSSPNIIINNDDNVTTFYAHDRFYVGVSQSNSPLSVYTSLSALTSWSSVTFNNPQSAYLSGVYYSSANNLDIYILYLGSEEGSNVTGVFYSNGGDTFTASTGITFSNANVTNVTYNDNDNDNTFYLSVSYKDDSLLQDTPIMYKSSDGKSWSQILSNNDLASVLPSSLNGDGVTGISQFFILDSSIVAVGTGDTGSFGLVSISLPDHTVTSDVTPIVLDNSVVNKLFRSDDAILVGVYEDTISENTIYYYDGNQGKLVATEHHEDVA